MNGLSPQEAQNNALRIIKARWRSLYFAKTYHRTTKDEPLTFGDKDWLKAIYKDTNPRIIIQKCSQVGITEYALCTMFALANQGRRGMYLLPDDDWRATFVTDRIDGLMNRCPKYKAATASVIEKGKEADNKQMKALFGMAWKFAGTNATTAASKKSDLKAPKGAFEFQSDVLMFDEYDQHAQENLEYFHDRLAASKNPLVFMFGNPTITGLGINAEFELSDQKYWHVPCEHCGHEHVLDWYKHFVRENEDGSFEPRDPVGFNPICEECGLAFHRLSPGRWVKHNPSARASGYAISRLFVYQKETDIKDLWDKFIRSLNNASKSQNFHNNWLGVPYENTKVKLTDPLLMKAADAISSFTTIHIGGLMTLLAGMDLGKDKHVRVSEMINGVRIARFIGALTSWDDVEHLIKEFHIGPFVVDAQGDGYEEVRTFIKKDLGNRWMCYYNLNDSPNQIYQPNYETGVIRANRTELLDTGVQHFKQGLIKHPLNWADILGGDYRKHLLTPVRVIDPNGRPIWTKGVDHLFHATCGYETAAVLVSGLHNSYSKQRSWAV